MTTYVQLHLLPPSVISAYVPHNLGGAVSDGAGKPNEYIEAMRIDGGAFQVYDERKIKKPCIMSGLRSKRQAMVRRELIPTRGSRHGVAFKPAENISLYQMFDGHLQSILMGSLAKRYSGNSRSMANELGIDGRVLDSYLKGALPRNAGTIRIVAKRLDLNEDMLIDLWEADAYDAIDFMYPVSPDVLPLGRELISLVRRATIRLGGLNTVKITLKKAGFSSIPTYVLWNDVYTGILDRVAYNGNLKGKHRHKPGTFKRNTPKIIAASGIAFEAEVILLMEELRREKRRWRQLQAENLMKVEEDVIGEAPWLLRTPDPRLADPFETTVMTYLSAVTRAVLKTLTPREEKVIRMRYGIGEEREYTVDEVAADFEITVERIKQIEGKALRKLKYKKHSRHLKSYWSD